MKKFINLSEYQLIKEKIDQFIRKLADKRKINTSLINELKKNKPVVKMKANPQFKRDATLPNIFIQYRLFISNIRI